MCLAAVTNSPGLICNFNNVCVQQYFNAFVNVPRTTKVQCKDVSQNKLIKVQQESTMSIFYSNDHIFLFIMFCKLDNGSTI